MTGQGQNRKQPISTWASRKRRKLTFAAGEAQRRYSAAAACWMRVGLSVLKLPAAL